MRNAKVGFILALVSLTCAALLVVLRSVVGSGAPPAQYPPKDTSEVATSAPRAFSPETPSQATASERPQRDDTVVSRTDESKASEPSGAARTTTGDSSMRKRLNASSSPLSGPACMELISRWDSASRNEREEIFDRLSENKRSALPQLRVVLQNGTPTQKILACRFIQESRDKDSENALLGALDDPDEEVQVYALLALRETGSTAAAEKVRVKLNSGPTEGVLKASLVTLGKLGCEQDIPLLRSYLTHENEVVRVDAAAGLALLGSEEGRDVLLTGTRSQNQSAQIDAITALGFRLFPEGKQRLEEILAAPEARWKMEAEIGLARLDLDASGSEADKLRKLSEYAGRANRQVAAWAVQEIAGMRTAAAREALAGIASQQARTGAVAQRLLRMTEEDVQ